MRFRSLIVAAALLAGGAAGAAGQLSIEPALTVSSAFLWRGLTLVSRPVVQPELGFGAGPASLAFWGNIEPAAYRGEDVTSVLAGRHAPGVTELDVTGELSHELGPVGVAAGAIAYLYTHAAGFETEPNTGEVYGRVAVGGPLPLELTAYYDVHSVRGTYVELSTERSAPRLPALVLAARLGASFGEVDGPETSYFQRDGLTHLELSAALSLSVGGMDLRPAAGLVLGFDPETRLLSPDGRTSRAKGWFGVSIAPGASEQD